ncbi:MAG: hypothetical protein ACJARE_002486, partial [Paracoccaceae bacterium]
AAPAVQITSLPAKANGAVLGDLPYPTILGHQSPPPIWP